MLTIYVVNIGSYTDLIDYDYDNIVLDVALSLVISMPARDRHLSVCNRWNDRSYKELVSMWSKHKVQEWLGWTCGMWLFFLSWVRVDCSSGLHSSFKWIHYLLRTITLLFICVTSHALKWHAERASHHKRRRNDKKMNKEYCERYYEVDLYQPISVSGKIQDIRRSSSPFMIYTYTHSVSESVLIRRWRVQKCQIQEKK